MLPQLHKALSTYLQNHYDSSSVGGYHFVSQGILYLLLPLCNEYLMHSVVNYLLQILLHSFYVDLVPTYYQQTSYIYQTKLIWHSTEIITIFTRNYSTIVTSEYYGLIRNLWSGKRQLCLLWTPKAI
jgi:hypothetical protein